ncbi:hypothetical protein GIB67_002278 [Kingdonia uniflora]|uniref:Protein kinase domain-containing protein n=1 Tax=Kingdonia uniflora TaxID=39325 RepID=A0A7J7KX02_9MAGN|nr:hypothetical protein GIB67_002278 [Kingdonia uniflora]
MVLMPQKFAIYFTLGCIIIIGSLFTFKGPQNEFTDMTSKEDGRLRIFEWPSLRILLDNSRAHKSFLDLDIRDTKLDNLLVTSTGMVKIGDFSISHVFEVVAAGLGLFDLLTGKGYPMDRGDKDRGRTVGHGHIGLRSGALVDEPAFSQESLGFVLIDQGVPPAPVVSEQPGTPPAPVVPGISAEMR